MAIKEAVGGRPPLCGKAPPFLTQDMKRPAFGVPAGPGLSFRLHKKNQLDECWIEHYTGVPCSRCFEEDFPAVLI